ncbi:MAG: 2-oxoglutarate dehydrogenase complex dihydrolipoyllysine-residue succinyltransferase [Chloroflexi bacterium]|nr:2-oxoglutarate dehydrogenase complex dihydrolipoyllysine-residue succinyltransferase [Chloroflexota bacterium]
MSTKIVVPSLGESIIEATVSKWYKKEGDRVNVGDPLLELETDKVNLDVGAEKSGVIAQIQKKEGEDVKVGDVLGVIDETDQGRPSTEAVKPETLKEEAAGASSPSGNASRSRMRVETAPTSITEAPADALGLAEGKKDSERVTPVARRMAQEHGVDATQVPPAKPGARVTKQDIEQYLQQQGQAASALSEMPAVTPISVSGKLAEEREERVLMSRRRRTIAQRLVEAQQTAAMLTTFNEIEMSAVVKIRRQWKTEFNEKYGVNLGIVSFFVKAVIAALRDFPMVNAELRGEEIIYKHYYDIGVAVGAAEGLVVPVLRDADRMSFAEIERQIRQFVKKTEDGTLSLEDLRGGTFTITNGGVFGSLLSTPILNPPQVGILGLHKIEDRPIAINNQVEIRPMMYVALSYDHRLVDGREAVQFLVKVKEGIENPELLLLES